MEKINLKNVLKKYSSTAFCRTGLLSLGGRYSTRNLTILSLHRVVTEAERSQSLYKPMMVTVGQFESLLDMIRRNYHPVVPFECGAANQAGAEIQARYHRSNF